MLAAAGIVAWMWSGEAHEAVVRANKPVFVCSETGKPFNHELAVGEDEPVKSPHSGKNTGWRAELCYWAKDGQGGWKAKLEPTYVLVKKRMDPTTDEKTYCPDCGHEVWSRFSMPPSELMQAAREEAGQ